MKLSVVTAVLNAADTLQQTIDSVQAQQTGSPEFELAHIIIDGGSTDGTVELIKRNETSLEQWVSEPDRGIYHGMNKGIALADGDVIGLLNADDVYQDATVLNCVAQCFEDQTVDACYGDLVYVAADNPEKIVRYWRSGDYRAGMFERGWMPAHPTFFVRRSVYQRLGVFNLGLSLQADFELTARFMAVHGIKATYLPKIMVRMRMGGATNRSIKNVIWGNLESYRACRNIGLKVTPVYFLTKFAMRIPQFFRSPGPGTGSRT